MKVDFDAIATRKDTLERARTELKLNFVGIDDTIDSLLDYIQIWYLLPEILTEQLIVQEINNIIQKTSTEFGILLNIDRSIHTLVYRNGGRC